MFPTFNLCTEDELAPFREKFDIVRGNGNSKFAERFLDLMSEVSSGAPYRSDASETAAWSLMNYGHSPARSVDISTSTVSETRSTLFVDEDLKFRHLLLTE